MTRRSTTGGKARIIRGGKPKRGIALKASGGRVFPAADQETKLARLTRELSEALEQQTATGDILKVIAGSPADVQRAIAKSW